MNHEATAEFWRAYQELPAELQVAADKAFALMKDSPRHPSLHLKKLKNSRWSVRISLGYRALAIQRGETLIWFWIGSHATYDNA